MATAVEIPNISALLDRHLELQRIAEGEREITGGATWRASQLGKCLRQQYLRYVVKKPLLQEDDALSLKRFEIGHFWGARFSQWFSDMGFAVEEEVEWYDHAMDLGAHVDFIISRPGLQLGVELKSVNSKWFWYRARSDGDTASPENMMQAATYDLMARAKGYEFPWIVLTVSKDDLTMEQDVVTAEHRKAALARIILLNAAKATMTPPACTCTDPNGEWNGNGWKYCGYYAGDRKTDIAAALAHSKIRAKNKPKFVVPAACCEVA